MLSNFCGVSNPLARSAQNSFALMEVAVNEYDCHERDTKISILRGVGETT